MTKGYIVSKLCVGRYRETNKESKILKMNFMVCCLCINYHGEGFEAHLCLFGAPSS